MLTQRMRPLFTFIAVFLLAVTTVIGQARTTLDIYVVDVEGGNAVLFVTPAGESVLIDTGNLDGATRDAARIMDAARDAGLTKIDHLIITHYHGDHLGGLPELAKRMPIQEFFDHGMNIQPSPAADAMLKVYSTEALWTIVNDAFQIHGGAAYFCDRPLERMLRHAYAQMGEES